MGGFEVRPAKILDDDARAAQWAARIAENWRSSIQGIIATGELIAEAKADLPKRHFKEMVKDQLPFGRQTAYKLMAIAADPRVSNVAYMRHFPASWGSLYEITKLDNAEFEARISDGTIHPEMEQRDIVQVIKAVKRAQSEKSLSGKIMALPRQKFGVILADPEWRFEPWSRATGMDRSADNHYPTSCTEVIASRDVASIAADDCVLFLWATVPMLPQALLVMGAWGFDYRSHCIWSKRRDGSEFGTAVSVPAVGTGYWFRNCHELLLVGVKGKIPAPAPGSQEISIIEGHIREHSRKPDYFLEIIERLFPTLPKIELNRRGPPRPNWAAWGNETSEAA